MQNYHRRFCCLRWSTALIAAVCSASFTTAPCLEWVLIASIWMESGYDWSADVWPAAVTIYELCCDSAVFVVESG